MHVAGKLLDHIDETRRWPDRLLVEIHDVADLDGIEIAPHGPRSQVGELGRGAFAVAVRKNDVIGLQAHHFFDTQLRPILLR